MTAATLPVSDPDRQAKRNAIVLAAAQAFYGVTIGVLVTIGGLVGQMLAPDGALATLPVTLMVVGTALSTITASWLMGRIGRRPGFMLGAGMAIIAALTSAYAVYEGNFALFCAASLMNGFYQAFAMFYRFAAADTASDAYKPKAIALVLAGGLVAAFVGPQVVIWTKDLYAPFLFVGCFIATAITNVMALVVLALLNIPKPVRASHGQSGRPLKVLLAQPKLKAAIACGTISYGVMALVMHATPLAMLACNYGVTDAAIAIQWHVVAMYAPSFFTGHLIARFGQERVIFAGLGLLAACGAVALSGVTIAQFWLAMILLGVGWNFAFVGATAMVTECHRPEERARVQGFNDFCVFGFTAACSFLSGFLIDRLGWDGVNITLFPLVVAAGLLLLVLSRRSTAAGLEAKSIG